jgi:hypothetical protein
MSIVIFFTAYLDEYWANQNPQHATAISFLEDIDRESAILRQMYREKFTDERYQLFKRWLWLSLVDDLQKLYEKQS